MFIVMIDPCDGSSSYEHDRYARLEDAQRAVQTARLSYPEGSAWIENGVGEIFPTPIL